jgi:mRNA interferase RelE/StbE
MNRLNYKKDVLLTEYRIFETAQFQADLETNLGARKDKLISKLRTLVYPQLRRQPHFGKNIKKLRDFDPETWRYRVGDFRFFYAIDDKQKIVSLIAADIRSKAYRRR